MKSVGDSIPQKRSSAQAIYKFALDMAEIMDDLQYDIATAQRAYERATCNGNHNLAAKLRNDIIAYQDQLSNIEGEVSATLAEAAEMERGS